MKYDNKNKFYKFETLDVWKNAVDLVNEVYKVVNKYPKTELYALSDQTKRAVVSISLNIAEGSGYGTKKEFVKFLRYSRGSLYEVITTLQIALNMDYINQQEYDKLDESLKVIHAQINGLMKHLKQ